MKSLLIASSALVAVAFVGSASAAEPIKLSIGGYGAGYVTYASQSDSYLNATGKEYNAVNVYGDNQIHFKGQTTLDNGLTVAAKYKFQAGGKKKDYNNLWNISASGVFGSIQIGTEDTASNALYLGSQNYNVRLFGGTVKNDLPSGIVSTPSGIGFTPSGDIVYRTSDFATTKYKFAPGVVDISPAVNPQREGAPGLSYYTPSVYGFTLGATYHPSANALDNGIAIDGKNGSDEAYTIALQWKGNIAQDVTLGLSTAYGTIDVDKKDKYRIVPHNNNNKTTSTASIWDLLTLVDGKAAKQGTANVTVDSGELSKYTIDNQYQWGIGGQIGYAGFGFGGSYKKVNIDVKRPVVYNEVDISVLSPAHTGTATVGQRRNMDKTVWELGLSYDAQPYVVSLNYTKASAQQIINIENDDKLWQLQLTGQYAMGPGVKLEAGVAYVSMKDGLHAWYNKHHDEAAGGFKNEAWVIGTGLNLSF